MLRTGRLSGCMSQKPTGICLHHCCLVYVKKLCHVGGPWRSHGIGVPPDGPSNCVSTTPTTWQWCSWRSTEPPTGKCDDGPREWMPPDKRNSVQVRRPLWCGIAEQVRGGEGQPESWQHDGLRGRAKHAGGVGEGAGSGVLGDDCSYPMIVSGCGDRLFGTHRQPNYTDTRSHVGAVFKSACLGVSESDECRAAPKSRAERRSGAVRECPQLPAHAPWIGHVEGTGMRDCARPIWPE